jgi:hypothetical protein
MNKKINFIGLVKDGSLKKALCYTFVLMLAIIIPYYLVYLEVGMLRKEEGRKINEVILRTVKENVDRNILAREIVFVGIDTLKRKILADSLVTQISRELSNGYYSNRERKIDDNTLARLFVFPQKPDKNGNYVLSEHQLDELKSHIVYLSTQVDKAVAETKEEVGKDIERVNTWVTIWIGILGFMGIFIPLIINFYNRDEVNITKEIANNAKTAADSAMQTIADHGPQLARIAGLSETVKDLQTQYDNIIVLSNGASESAEKAIASAEQANNKSTETDNIFYAFHAKDRLYQFEPTNLIRIKYPLKLLHSYLTSIHREYMKCSNLYHKQIVKEYLDELSTRIKDISLLNCIDKARIKLLNDYAVSIDNALSQGLTQDSYNRLMEELKKLVDGLG